MGKGYLLVEGHGELGAVDNLIHRLTARLEFPLAWAPARRWLNLHQQTGAQRGASRIRVEEDAEALLILRDEDDRCPAQRAPAMARWLEDLRLPFPAAIVLFHPEYEVLFLPCLQQMAGKPLGTGAAARPGIRLGTHWDGPWESRRGIKEWLTSHFEANRSYKPTLDQLPLTRLIDLPTLRRAEVPCFETLERALAFLARGLAGAVYPPPTAD